ncbi:hypothetical protein [Rhizobium sp. Rhizsp82]|uniref:hypothetical protein n=1 Tax=Rhizobium sp. Rhizsp82 TaxID=3243057 RepID=UPI0039B6BD2E
MSEKMTLIRLPNAGSGEGGILEWGEVPASEMIERLRSFHRFRLELAQKILAAPDHAFQVDVVRGSIVQKHIKTLQTASPIE